MCMCEKCGIFCTHEGVKVKWKTFGRCLTFNNFLNNKYYLVIIFKCIQTRARLNFDIIIIIKLIKLQKL